MAINRLKDPPTWLKVATTLENPLTPTHVSLDRLSNKQLSGQWNETHLWDVTLMLQNGNNICQKACLWWWNMSCFYQFKVWHLFQHSWYCIVHNLLCFFSLKILSLFNKIIDVITINKQLKMLKIWRVFTSIFCVGKVMVCLLGNWINPSQHIKKPHNRNTICA